MMTLSGAISPAMILRVGIGFSVVMMAAGAWMMQAMKRERRMQARLAGVHDRRTEIAKGANAKAPPRSAFKLLAGIGQAIMRSGVVSSQTSQALTRSLESAGIRGGNGVGIFVACKIFFAVALPVLGFFLLHDRIHSTPMRNSIIGTLAVVGLLAPDYIVRSMRKRYQLAISNGLPDVLDMLVMCAESGLSLEPAINRVGMEVSPAHPAVGSELMLTAHEFQISTDSNAVLMALGERTGLADMKRVVATLAQTLQYGTPLAEALRVLSAEMRTEILTRYEEKAAKLPVLLTLPMIMFILPSLFLVVGGPAMLQALRIFSK
jgi:tight adherence protein C